jgi:hypothetical protein
MGRRQLYGRGGGGNDGGGSGNGGNDGGGICGGGDDGGGRSGLRCARTVARSTGGRPRLGSMVRTNAASSMPAKRFSRSVSPVAAAWALAAAMREATEAEGAANERMECATPRAPSACAASAASRASAASAPPEMPAAGAPGRRAVGSSASAWKASEPRDVAPASPAVGGLQMDGGVKILSAMGPALKVLNW